MADIVVTENSGKYLTFAQLVAISRTTSQYAKTVKGECLWIDTSVIEDANEIPRYDDVNSYEWPVNLEFKVVDRMRVRIILTPNLSAWLDMTQSEFNSLSSKDIYTEAQYERCECKSGETCHKGRSGLLDLDDYDVFNNIIISGHAEEDIAVHRGVQKFLADE